MAQVLSAIPPLVAVGTGTGIGPAQRRSCDECAGRLMQTMSHHIVSRLKALKLHGMARSGSEMVAQARLAEFDPERFMTQMLNSETAEREVRSIAYRMTAGTPGLQRLQLPGIEG